MKNILLAVVLMFSVACYGQQPNVSAGANYYNNNTIEEGMDMIEEELSAHFDEDAAPFTRYALLTVFGRQALLLSQKNGPSEALFIYTEDHPFVLVACHQETGRFEFFEKGVKHIVGCGPGCSTTDYIMMTEDGPEAFVSHYLALDPYGNVEEQSVELIDSSDDLSEEEARMAIEEVTKAMGRKLIPKIKWNPMP